MDLTALLIIAGAVVALAVVFLLWRARRGAAEPTAQVWRDEAAADRAADLAASDPMPWKPEPRQEPPVPPSPRPVYPPRVSRAFRDRHTLRHGDEMDLPDHAVLYPTRDPVDNVYTDPAPQGRTGHLAHDNPTSGYTPSDSSSSDTGSSGSSGGGYSGGSDSGSSGGYSGGDSGGGGSW